jgi:hypothetical protein
MLRVTVALDAADGLGTAGDWWLAVKTLINGRVRWFSYRHPSGWRPGLVVSHQGPLFNLREVALLERPLPPGRYTVYFGVDLTPDGQVDRPVHYDSAVVNCLP